MVSLITLACKGLAILRSKFDEAIDLILKPQDYDQKDLLSAKRHYMENKDAAAALELMPRHGSVAETALLRGLSNCNQNDYVHAFSLIPRNLKNMYAHSYQSLVWNEMSSARLQLLGDAVVEGDLVLSVDQTDPEPALEDQDAVEPIETDDQPEPKRVHASDILPHVVTAQEAADKTYSLQDVVLPLPGTAVSYPTHQIGDMYKARLERDGVLDVMHKGHRMKEFTLYGGYRSVVVLPGDLEHEVLYYTNSNQDLARTDLDALLGRPPHSAMQTEGPFKAVKLEFTLPPSTYATMCLRELMKTSTAASFHHKKCEDQEKALKPAPDGAAPEGVGAPPAADPLQAALARAQKLAQTLQAAPLEAAPFGGVSTLSKSD